MQRKKVFTLARHSCGSSHWRALTQEGAGAGGWYIALLVQWHRQIHMAGSPTTTTSRAMGDYFVASERIEQIML